MGAMFAAFARVALQVLAGIGIGELLDKTVADKVPGYEPVTAGINPLKPGFKPVKLILTIAVFAVAAMVVMFIGKKMKIKLLK